MIRVVTAPTPCPLLLYKYLHTDLDALAALAGDRASDDVTPPCQSQRTDRPFATHAASLPRATTVPYSVVAESVVT